jgi:alpha-1,2-mannosyltransferase
MTGDDSEVRPPLVFWACLWLCPLAPQLVSAVSDVSRLHGLLIHGPGTWIGRDFSNVWIGGHLARQGVNLYDLDVFVSFVRNLGIPAAQNYSYPPHTLFYAIPLSYLPYLIALALWGLTGAFLFYRAAKPIVPFNPAWILLWLPFLFFNGQYGGIIAALWLWSFRPNQVRAGVAAGLLSIKPHLGVLLALATLGKMRLRQIVIAAVIGGGLVIAAELSFGLTSAYLTDGVAGLGRIASKPNQPFLRQMPSAFVGIGLFAHILESLAALWMLWRIRSYRFEEMCFPLATATFIFLPYGFNYDMMAVSLGFAILLYSRWPSLRIGEKCLGALAFAAPALTASGVASIFLLGGLYLQTIRASKSMELTK